jgi:hypothetical protein
MRVLVANIPLPHNRFLVDLNAALSEHCAVQHSSDAFWSMEGDYDVVHLHFPEYLTYEVERAYLAGLTAELIEAVEERLRFWAARSSLVVTRHVLLPHDAREDPMWEKMYETVYAYADGVVHFGHASIEEFRTRYASTAFNRGREPRHEIIPHQNYASLPNEIGRNEARRRLRIRPTNHVMLVFGAIRSDSERRLIEATFENLEVPGKILLVSSWRERMANVSWIRLKYWFRDLTRLYHRIHPQHRFNYGFVEEGDAQLYLNAADVLFIPRLHVLNSGNVTLGMTFGLVVVGPDSLNVGELLRQTGNPVFDPEYPQKAAAAVMDGLRRATGGRVGPANREMAMAEWDVRRCAALYAQFFLELKERRFREVEGRAPLQPR